MSEYLALKTTKMKVVSIDPDETAHNEPLYIPVLQIRRGNRDNLGMISHISPLKHLL